MESLSRVILYKALLADEIYSYEYAKELRMNIDVLEGIESLFLSQDSFPSQKQDMDPNILNQLRMNINRISEWVNKREESNLINKLEKLYIEYIDGGKAQPGIYRNLFNKIINELSEYNNKKINRVPGNPSRREGMIQVFLSHAYMDRLYALALFDYFYRQNIYLYVDWMHHGEEVDGKKLKHYLDNELDNSSQLLYLRTLNSELDIQGKQYLRPWCAWEMGNFYCKGKNQKYLINLYSVDDYKNSNIQLHGLKLYTGVVNGKLVGREIVL